ncbi:type IV secretion system protein, partial [Acidithiobacillus sp. MC6.1]|nr:type IV secretion system protein [Acidithiobacillus sp. MC6.1]
MHIKNVSTSKMVTLAIILAAALFLLPNISHAATDYFNSPQSTIESSFNGIVGGVYNAAKELFMGLAFIEVTWFFIIVTINRREMDFIVVEALKKVMSLGLFYAFLSVTASGLSDGNWFYYFANHMGTLGASLGGATAKSPTSLIDQGLTNFGNLLNAPFQGLAASTQVQGHGVIGNLIGSAFKSMNVVSVLMAIWLSLEILPPDIVMLLAYVLLALRVFMINIEMYFVLSVGILLLGAGGSRWTTQYARNYINYTVSVGIRLFTIYVVAGISDNLMMKQAITLASIAKELANGSQVSNLIPQVWGMGVTFFSIALLILMVPKFAANLTSGQSTAGVGDVLAPAAAVAAAAVGAGALAAGGAAGLMGAGKALGNATGGSVGGGSGVMSVADAAKMGDGAGSGGFGGSVSGGSGPAGGTPPGSGSGNGTGTAPGIAPASLSP